MLSSLSVERPKGRIAQHQSSWSECKAEGLNCPASVILERSDGIQDFVFYFLYEVFYSICCNLPFGGVVCRRNA